MKISKIQLSISTALLTILLAAPLYAVPSLINYQGVLVDSGGNPVPNGNYNATFSFYDGSGGGANLLYSEDHTLTTEGGRYNLLLGNGLYVGGSEIALTDTFAANEIVYLGIAVGGDLEMTPRIQIQSVAYALRAGDADTLAPHEASPSVHHSRYDDAEAISAVGPHTVKYTDAEAISAVGSHTVKYTDAEAITAVGPHTVKYTDAEAIAALTATIANLQAQIDTNATNISTNITAIAGKEDEIGCLSETGTEVTFEGCNVNVKSGAGTTDALVNGLGNLVVGYGENLFGYPRAGSHNLVVGPHHGYGDHSGLVAGQGNQVLASYATVSGGTSNQASGLYASVSGGAGNAALGVSSSVSGGNSNTASAGASSVSGGFANSALGNTSSVSGGFNNISSGINSSISGGNGNRASGASSSISGGDMNTALGDVSSVSGGKSNIASSSRSSVGGGDGNQTSNLCVAGTQNGQDCNLLGRGACTGGGGSCVNGNCVGGLEDGNGCNTLGWSLCIGGGGACNDHNQSFICGGNSNASTGVDSITCP